MSLISPFAKPSCEEGFACEWLKSLDEYMEPKHTLSKKSEYILNITARVSWAGIGAATNYLSNGDPIGGALFNLIIQEMNRGIDFAFSKLSLLEKKHFSQFTIRDIRIGIAKKVVVLGVSLFAVAAALNALGYPIAKTTIAINSIVFINLGNLIRIRESSLKSLKELMERMDEVHMEYHKKKVQQLNIVSDLENIYRTETVAKPFRVFYSDSFPIIRTRDRKKVAFARAYLAILTPLLRCGVRHLGAYASS